MWIYEVCRDFRYSGYTFTTAVMLIDKYTEKNGFELFEYQLIGIAALLLAAKIEEPKTMPVSEYATVTDSAFTKKEIIAMEWRIIESLDKELYVKLPQGYFNPENFRVCDPEICIEKKKELLNCFIAMQLEIRSYSKNVFLLYLEAKKELENYFRKKEVSKSAIFYIENNIILEKLKMK